MKEARGGFPERYSKIEKYSPKTFLATEFHGGDSWIPLVEKKMILHEQYGC